MQSYSNYILKPIGTRIWEAPLLKYNSEMWKCITCWSQGLIVKLTIGLHTYQAANNIYGQSLGYLDHVHSIHGSFLHYQPGWWRKEKNDQKSDMIRY